MKNQYEIDYQQGYDTANDEWLDRIDKIRAEIEQSYCTVNNDYDHERNYGLYMATQIIDKYKPESEES